MPKGIGWDDPHPLTLPDEEGSPPADNDVSGTGADIGYGSNTSEEAADGAAAEKPRRKKPSKSSSGGDGKKSSSKSSKHKKKSSKSSARKAESDKQAKHKGDTVEKPPTKETTPPESPSELKVKKSATQETMPMSPSKPPEQITITKSSSGTSKSRSKRESSKAASKGDPYGPSGGGRAESRERAVERTSPKTRLDTWNENEYGDVEVAIPHRSTPPKKGAGAGDTVSCCGSVVNKRHLIAGVILCIVIAGAAVAALLVTGVLGGDSSKAQSSTGGDDSFAPLTFSPTSENPPGRRESLSPTSTPASALSTPTRRPTLYPTHEPTVSPKPTITIAPTSCTNARELFKYFGNDGAVYTTSCKKLTLSMDDQEDKCSRVVVFGGGDTVRTLCPLLCGACADTPTTDYPTDRPTKEPTARPTEPKVVAVDSSAVDPSAADPSAVDPSAVAAHESFSFYIMGDIPYMYREEVTLIEQLQDQTKGLANDDAVFQVHVGDIQNPSRTQCAAERYSRIAGYFKDYSGLPNLMLPGDNDWNDCPNPDLAWEHWTSNFLAFENNWADRSSFPSTVERQDIQPENFAFIRAGVLFLGMNLVGGRTNEYVTEQDWTLRIDRDILWATQYFSKYNVGTNTDLKDPNYIRAVIIFGHSPRARRFNNFLRDTLMGTGIPVIYMHGNGHNYLVSQPFLDDGWDIFWQVQVDQGAHAPPVKVTVRGTTMEAMQMPMTVDGGMVFNGFIKFDRRGGLYPEVAEKLANTPVPSPWGP